MKRDERGLAGAAENPIANRLTLKREGLGKVPGRDIGGHILGLCDVADGENELAVRNSRCRRI